MEYAYDNHNVHLIVYHLIFCPKRRQKILVGPIQERLQQITQDVATENKWKVLELAIQPDHVHLVIRSNPRILPTDIARRIKGRSAHVLREEYPVLKRLPSLWTRSTFYSTAGTVSSETIRRYIERQSKT
ncbi:MAG TPA: IS200/IS605 family transposase [Ktedonobacteraceae bacterium]|jgi:putative transposase|nr:IS200/IS605 family transposase [Ktedonobacteraceae bacterium]